ncbi:hypothetical protein PSE10A_58750 [Pseudomonas amygdali pv. eriobotryae]|uniref:DUF1902 domain-containing protein n=1 Tax=Pseudomonas amygdali pv. eriobotryae TaxID=129137 RepID=A0A9P3EFW0_PSEA0|nr:DUF1902 domain-containing protein [Pseudomonas amygdali]GFZ63364.1 hypothetical protein PSE10A_58750 [Pseudomonas amygdali pv. eriobotryae]
MSNNPFVLRCYAEKKDGLWIAACPQFTLATQGESFDQAKEKLEAQIKSYIVEALTLDKEHAAELLGRRAPLSIRMHYALKTAAYSVVRLFSRQRDVRRFNEPALQMVY